MISIFSMMASVSNKKLSFWLTPLYCSIGWCPNFVGCGLTSTIFSALWCCKLCNFDIPRNNDFKKTLPSEYVVGMHCDIQGFSLLMSFFHQFSWKNITCLWNSKENERFHWNLAVAFKTILVLFRHLQSRFTSYFNKKNWVVLNRRY